MQPRFGTTYVERGGKLTRVVDRTGHVHAELTWRGDTLERLEVAGAILHGTPIRDPLLADAHALGTTAISAIDWSRPTEIPTVADPARLPPGAGGMILNLLALLAARAGVQRLRYAGPYPTPVLWRTLSRSFHTAATEAQFTADVLARTLRVARDPIAIDFTPAPFERIAHAHGWVELRDHLERAVIDGTTYDELVTVSRLTSNADATLVNVDTVPRAEVWIGDTVYAHVATFDADGTMTSGPHPIPACTSEVIGRAFPPALREAIAELVADVVPAPIAALARQAIATRTLAWEDLGGRVARRTETGFAVHAAMWERIAPRGLARLGLALAEALAPEVTRAIVEELAARAKAEPT